METQDPPLDAKMEANQSGSVLLRLPVDIFYLLGGCLCPASTSLIRMTCRALYHSIPPNQKPLQLLGNPWGDFNECLERDLAYGCRFYFCVYCHELHPFQPHWKSSTIHPWLAYKLYDHVRPRLAPPHHQLPSAIPLLRQDSALHISYFRAYWCLGRLVMNRHFFGALHGLPLDCFDEVVVSSGLYDHYTERTESAAARVIDNGFFLMRTMVWKSRNADQRDLFDYFCQSLQALQTWVCLHDNNLDEMTRYVLSRPGTTRSEIIPRRNIRGACSNCATDFHFTLERLKRQPGRKRSDWQITLVCFHQFGSCRGKLEDWASSRLGRLDEGQVRKKWLESKAAKEQNQGTSGPGTAKKQHRPVSKTRPRALARNLRSQGPRRSKRLEKRMKSIRTKP